MLFNANCLLCAVCCLLPLNDFVSDVMYCVWSSFMYVWLRCLRLMLFMCFIFDDCYLYYLMLHAFGALCSILFVNDWLRLICLCSFQILFGGFGFVWCPQCWLMLFGCVVLCVGVWFCLILFWYWLCVLMTFNRFDWFFCALNWVWFEFECWWVCVSVYKTCVDGWLSVFGRALCCLVRVWCSLILSVCLFICLFVCVDFVELRLHLYFHRACLNFQNRIIRLFCKREAQTFEILSNLNNKKRPQSRTNKNVVPWKTALARLRALSNNHMFQTKMHSQDSQTFGNRCFPKNAARETSQNCSSNKKQWGSRS